MASLVFRLCDNAPEILRDVCIERGWKEYEEDEDEEGAWNLWWKSSGFRTGDFESCRPWQRLNHFPKSNSITRKDILARNLRRMKGVYGNVLFNFAPLSFNLPNDYRKFVTEYSNTKKRSLWICKPADQSRGKGIFLFRNLTDLTYDCATVVQQYIQNPLLIAGYKFDLRLYVLVTSFHPLQIYLYHEGLARFGTEKFDLNSLDNVYSHLTNTSINKLSPFYATDKERIGSGCKWSLGQLRTYFYQNNINNQLLWHRITAIVILTLLMQAPEVQKDTNNCFELFGFDILIDTNLKPWLLEVNFSPSLGIDCSLDITIKKALLDDTLKAINLKESDHLPCSLSGCITKIGTCGKNQRSSSRASSNFSFYSSKSKVNASSRFYTRSRLSQMSQSIASRTTKEQSENESPEHASNTDEEVNDYSEINNNIEREESLTNSYDSLLAPSSSQCGAMQEISECNDALDTPSVVKETQEICCDCKSKKTCKLHCAIETKLLHPNSSEEFKKAYSYTRAPRASIMTEAERSSSSKMDYFGARSTLPESSFSEEDDFSSDNPIAEDCQSPRAKTQRTKLPPLKRSIKKATSFPFVKRSPKITPYLPTKGRKVPTKPVCKLSLMNCPCGHSSQGWGAYRMNPAKQIGDYILVFPFNDITQKACTSKQFDSKSAINEVKKVIQKITSLEKNKSKSKPLAEDEKEKFDLTKPFWGFSSLFNNWSS